MDKNIRRGQVWFHKPSVTPSGHIQKGPRPVIIVSNDVLNQSSSVVLGVPCTTQIKRNFPTHVLFIMNKTVNVALTEQVSPINVDELTTFEYNLEEYIMNQVDDALKITLGFMQLPSSRPSAPPVSVTISSPVSYSHSVNEPVDTERKGTGGQIDKFYKKYPHLAPKPEPNHNKWTPERVKQFLLDYEACDNRESVAKKYNLTTSSAYTYYRKFKSIIHDRDKAIGE